jgi:hypothetical protein
MIINTPDKQEAINTIFDVLNSEEFHAFYNKHYCQFENKKPVK